MLSKAVGVGGKMAMAKDGAGEGWCGSGLSGWRCRFVECLRFWAKCGLSWFLSLGCNRLKLVGWVET